MRVSSVWRARALLAGVAAACIFAPVRLAFAADPPKPSTTPAPAAAPAQSEADRLFEEGVAARKTNNLAEAEDRFRKAWHLKKTWDIAANLGLVELKLGKLSEGAEHVAFAIANLPPTESDSTRERLAKALEAARPGVAEIRVESDTPGAEVLVNDQPRGTTPLAAPLFVAPGHVTIEVRKDGYTAKRRTIEMQKGGSEEVRFSLMRETSVPVGAGPRSEVWVTGAALAGASAIAGAVLFGAGAAKKGEADALRADLVGGGNEEACAVPSAEPRCKQFTDAAGASQAMTNTAGALMIGAGLLALGTVAYVLVAKSATKGAPVQAAVVWTPTGGGAVVRASW